MKRSALLFDSSSPSDPSGSKRVMPAPSFDAQRAESTHQNLMAGAPLDVKRAQAAYQNVRALNTQFASWVQSQLQNHPDELWEDGVRDYLNHASGIMEKFKDVVDWLRSNAAKPTALPSSGTIFGQKNLLAVPESNKQASKVDNKISFFNQDSTVSNLQKPDSGVSGLFPAGSEPKFPGFFSDQNKLVTHSDNTKPTIPQDIQNGATGQTAPMTFPRFQSSASQGSGLFSFSHKPGNQGESSKIEAPEDVDEENEPEKPSSPSLKKAEEKGVAVVYETKCKVYRKPDDPADKAWKDIGVGQLCIKCKEGAAKATKDSKPTIVIRNDVGKILLNALIYSGIKMNIQKNTIASIFHTSGDVQGEDGSSGVVSRMYLLKMKNEEETTKLAEAIKDFAPSE